MLPCGKSSVDPVTHLHRFPNPVKRIGHLGWQHCRVVIGDHKRLAR